MTSSDFKAGQTAPKRIILRLGDFGAIFGNFVFNDTLLFGAVAPNSRKKNCLDAGSQWALFLVVCLYEYPYCPDVRRAGLKLV
jgi:hypothetical protein